MAVLVQRDGEPIWSNTVLNRIHLKRRLRRALNPQLVPIERVSSLKALAGDWIDPAIILLEVTFDPSIRIGQTNVRCARLGQIVDDMINIQQLAELANHHLYIWRVFDD